MNHINDFSNKLFAKDNEVGSRLVDFLPGPSISTRENTILNAPLTWQEVKNVVFSMKPMKAPWPDGFQPGFYKKYWDKVGVTMFNFLKKCFSRWNIPKEVNKCFTTLIPKIDNPESISHFRPITLCNVSYRIVTQILVNRIKPL